MLTIPAESRKQQRVVHCLLVEYDTTDSAALRCVLAHDNSVSLDSTFSMPVALRRLRDVTYDAIIVEISNWAEATIDALRTLRSLAPKTSITVISRTPARSFPKEADTIGIDHFLLAAYLSRSELCRRVKHALKTRRSAVAQQRTSAQFMPVGV